MKRRDALLGALAITTAATTPLFASASTSIAPPKSGPVRVGIVVGNRATVIDFAGPWEAFESAQSDQGFELFMVSDTTKTLTATGGMQIVPLYTYETAPQPNVIVMGAQGDHTPEKIAWIRQAGAKADLVMSVCTGAFLLAETGLLDGLTATTHHDFYDKFAEQFPRVNLVRGPRYVEHDKVASAGGLTSGFELALRVVERYYGARAANQTAYYMEYNRSSQRPSRLS